MTMKKKFDLSVRELSLLGLIVAIRIVLGKISFGPAMVQVGLGFIGDILLGYLFGPLWGGIGGGISDLISSALFGNQGGFFIGFTLSAILGPVIDGFFFYQKPVKVWRIIAATLLVTLLVDIGLNTLWLHLLYGVGFKAALIQRVPKELLTPWIQIIVAYITLEAFSHGKLKQYFSKEEN